MASIKCGECKGTHDTVAEVKDCYAQAAAYEAQVEGEVYAEALSSWCAGGGDYVGGLTYASVIASGKTWDEYLRERDEEVGRQMAEMGECEHGLSAALCAGPGHYPMDSYFD